MIINATVSGRPSGGGGERLNEKKVIVKARGMEEEKKEGRKGLMRLERS